MSIGLEKYKQAFKRYMAVKDEKIEPLTSMPNGDTLMGQMYLRYSNSNVFDPELAINVYNLMKNTYNECVDILKGPIPNEFKDLVISYDLFLLERVTMVKLD